MQHQSLQRRYSIANAMSFFQYLQDPSDSVAHTAKTDIF